MTGCTTGGEQRVYMSNFRARSLVLVLVLGTWASEAGAQSGVSCVKSVGKSRAQRLVNQCVSVTTATHPPCNVEFDCSSLLAHTVQMCGSLGAQAPAFCRERAVDPGLSESTV